MTTLAAHEQCKPTKLTTFFLLLQCRTAVAILAPMRFSVKRLRATTALFVVVQALLAAAAIAVNAEPNGPEQIGVQLDEVDELDRWVPAISIDLGLMIQETRAGFLTGGIKDPAWIREFPASERIRQSASGNSRPFAPVSGLSLELMTPGIPIPARPRMFVHGEAIASFPHTFRTAKNGDVDDFSLAFLPDQPSAGDNTEQVIRGQGGTLKSRLQRWQFAAGAGIAFTADIWGRRIRVKPSFEYLTQEIQVSGLIKRVTEIVDRPRTFDDLRLIILESSTTKRYHGIGAGMELEMDARRGGPLLVSMFANVRVYRFLGDRKVNLEDTNSFGEEAIFRFKLEPYTYRTAIGIRFRFAPE